MNRTNKGANRVLNAGKEGFFGIGIIYPKMDVNIGTLLRSSYCFGASFVFTIGKRYKKQSSDTIKTPNKIPLYHYGDLEDFKHHGIPYNCQVVGAELLDESTLLHEFEHPNRCVYLLGAEDTGLPEDARTMCHHIVEIPSLHCLNVAMTGSIIMSDRISKH